jgi:cell division protein FtsZ
MWRKPVTIFASNATATNYRRAFATSMQKKALKALGNRAAPPSSTKEEETSSDTVLSDIQKDTTPKFLNSPPNGDVPQKLSIDAMPPQVRVLVEEQPPSKPILGSALGQLHEFAPKIVVAGVGGAGGNALNNMIAKDLQGTYVTS